MAFQSGKNGRVTINSITLKVTEWRVSPKIDNLDFTHSESAGFGVHLGGVTEVEFECSFDYDVGTQPFSAMTFATPGTYASAVFFIGSSSGPFWSIPTALIYDGENTSTVRGKVSGRLRGVSTGSYTAPST